jgi:hypothetical protein
MLVRESYALRQLSEAIPVHIRIFSDLRRTILLTVSPESAASSPLAL